MVRLPWESWQFPQNRKQRRDLAVPFRAHAREEVKQGCEQTSAQRGRAASLSAAEGGERGRRRARTGKELAGVPQRAPRRRAE